ncbi:MAG: 8-amino-7-oxononanoate synthase [Planctomycetota bacterium]
MKHVPHRLSWLPPALQGLRDRRLERHVRTREGGQSAQVDLDGTSYLSFASNDYLGLASDPRLITAAREAVDRYGWGGGASPLIVGHSTAHHRLEQALAEFEHAEAALLFPSGFAANAGVIPALVGEGDVIFSDAANHASIIDGCRLSRARIEVYPHLDASALQTKLGQSPSAGRKLIVTDGLFSMDGDVAPLAEIAALADQHDAMLMVDEAHATGTLGREGRGAAEQCGVESRVDVKLGTLSKALGTMGGFVAGRQSLIDWIRNRSRSYIFSTACPPANCAAGLAALDIVRAVPQRRTQLAAAAAALRNQLRAEGYDTGRSESHIIPILLGDAERALQLSQRLMQQGVLVPAIRPPSVPRGRSLLRVSLCWNHTADMRQALLDALAATRA